MLLFLTVIEDAATRHLLEELYLLYHKDLWYIAKDILNDEHEAQDVVQTAFIHVAKYLDKNFDPKCNKSRGLIVIIVRNLAINLYKQRQRRASVPIEEVAHVLEDHVFVTPEVYSLRLDNGKEVAKKLAAIKPDYADILTLKYTYEYSNQEIAELLKIKEGNVRARLSRAKKALHTVIGGESSEPNIK